MSRESASPGYSDALQTCHGANNGLRHHRSALNGSALSLALSFTSCCGGEFSARRRRYFILTARLNAVDAVCGTGNSPLPACDQCVIKYAGRQTFEYVNGSQWVIVCASTSGYMFWHFGSLADFRSFRQRTHKGFVRVSVSHSMEEACIMDI